MTQVRMGGNRLTHTVRQSGAPCGEMFTSTWNNVYFNIAKEKIVCTLLQPAGAPKFPKGRSSTHSDETTSSI